MKITNPHPDPDVNTLRRVFVAAKSARKRQNQNKQMTRWLGGELDDSPYFQAGLAQLKKCRAEGMLK